MRKKDSSPKKHVEKSTRFFFYGGNMKVNLYLNSLKVKTVKIADNEDALQREYRVRIWNRKEVLGHRVATVFLKPVSLLDSTDKEIDLNCVPYTGVNIGGINE